MRAVRSREGSGQTTRKSAGHGGPDGRWTRLALAALLLVALLPARAFAQFTEEARVTAAAFDDGAGDGTAVAISGDYAIVGAPYTDILGAETGVAYVLERDGSGVWMVVAKLVPSEAAVNPLEFRNSHFGSSVDIQTSALGTFAVVGAPDERYGPGTSHPGAVYIYERIAGEWTEVTRLTPPSAWAQEDFGWSVALSGGLLVVGAPGESTLGNQAGSAYVYLRYSGSWILDSELFGSNSVASDRFGADVDILGTKLLVLSQNHLTAYLFGGTLNGGLPPSYTWTEDARLLPGSAVIPRSISLVVIPGTSKLLAGMGLTNGSDLLLFEDLAGGGSHVELPSAQIPAPGSGLEFGYDVSLATVGSTILLAVGSPLDDTAGTDSGLVRVYERTGTDNWSLVDALSATDAASEDHLGRAVALSGLGGSARIMGGAPNADVHGTDSGSAYVFEEISSVWSQAAQQLPRDDDPLDRFGESIAMQDSTLLVGAPGDDGRSLDAGALYVFEKVAGSWTGIEKLQMPAGVQEGTEFAISVAISGDYAIVGAPNVDLAGAPDGGVVYFFERIGGVWTLADSLAASDASSGANLGASVDIDGDFAIAGAPGANAAYVFTNDFYLGWYEEAKLQGVAPPLSPADFGDSVAISGDRALVGDPFESNVPFYRAGGVYAFRRTGSGWSQEARLGPPGPGTAREHFGDAVALDGPIAAVGAPGTTALAGAAYVWRREETSWSQIEALSRPVSLTGAEFGSAVDVDGPWVAVGEIGTVDPGTAWVYSLVTGSLLGSVSDPLGVAGDGHGQAVAVDGARVAVGAPGATAGDTDAGAATIYVPEPDFLLGLGAGACLLAMLSSRRRIP